MADDFTHDVFLSHSSQDQAIVRDIAERLRADGLRVWFDEWAIRPGDNIPAKHEEGLEHSRVLVLCMSANAFGADWAQLETGTFRFRDPLNKQRRFLPLRLDEAPLRGSLAQFSCVDWRAEDREQCYAVLLHACRATAKSPALDTPAARKPFVEKAIQLGDRGADVLCYAFSPDGQRALTGGQDKLLRLWDLETRLCIRVFKGHKHYVRCVAWSADQRFALSGSYDDAVRLWSVKTGSCRRVLKGHTGSVYAVSWSADHRRALSSSQDQTVRLWDMETGRCLRIYTGHTGPVLSVSWSPDQRHALSGSDDATVRLWDVESGQTQRMFHGHLASVGGLEWGADQRRFLSSSGDRTMRLWEVDTGRCLRVFEDANNLVSLSWSGDQRHVVSCGWDGTARLWDVEKGTFLLGLDGHTGTVYAAVWSADQRRVFSGDIRGGIRVWDLSDLVSEGTLPSVPDQVQYTNAKVLLVGDTSSGKTGLAHRLATGKWQPSADSTVGAWSTQWKLDDGDAEASVDREIWLWDFGGQADQRLVHQLYMDHAALILLLFNADQESVLPGLRDWQTALKRCVPPATPQFLVAGRIDTGFKASRGKLQRFAKEQALAYYETSAREGTGCEELHDAIMTRIPWPQMEKRTSLRLFKSLKDEILKLRDEGQTLHTFKELRELLWKRLEAEAGFTDETLETVIGLLDGPGVVKELDYGTYVLLQPEWVNAYAQAVIRTLRSDETELGCLPLRSIAEGKLLYQRVGREGAMEEMKRLPPTDERIVLAEMERQLMERGLCLRQGDKLVFPSHCGRDRPAIEEHPSVFVSYAVDGYLDDVYSTLVVKLADSESFDLEELWRDAADFNTLVDAYRMGIKLTRESASSGSVSVYFGPGVIQKEQVIFANYIHAHLEARADHVQRLRHYVCPNCHTPKGNPEVLMKKLLAKRREADTECDMCEERFCLWDGLERRFASKTVREQVEGLQAEDVIRLDSRRKGKLLVLEVQARITSADQKCFEIPATEDEGLDMELEFTDDSGRGTGQRLYLQLKAGNAWLRKRKKDGVEIFAIKKQRWVKYWLKQPHPVMLVIGTFAEDDERLARSDKLEFADVRWMEISSYLRRKSQQGTKQVRSIEFRAERLDMASVYRRRERTLKEMSS